MGATVTSLVAKLELRDVNFGSGLDRAEQHASKFSKQINKVSGGVGRIIDLASSLETVATSAGSADSALAKFGAGMGSTAATVAAGTNLVFGLRGAFDALKKSMLTNPIGIVIAGAAAVAGVLLSIFRDTKSEVRDTRTEVEKMLASPARATREFAAMIERAKEARKESAAAAKIDGILNADREKRVSTVQEAKDNVAKLKDPEAARRNQLIRDGLNLGEVDQVMEMEAEAKRIEEDRMARQKRLQEAEEKRRELAASLAELERNANEAWMTESAKKLAMLERQAKAAGQQFDREKARKQLEAAEAPERMRGQIADAEKRVKELEAKEKKLAADEGKRMIVDSPTFLNKGTAEAELFADRQKNQIEKLTDVQKQQLAETRKAKAIAEKQLAELKRQQKAKVVSI